MAGIVIFGGTVEGRKLAEALIESENELHISVATEYGGALLPRSGEHIHVHTGRLAEEEMEQFLRECRADYCVDATHPYAAVVTENIYEACKKIQVPYIRILRENTKMQEDGGITYVNSVEEAVTFLAGTHGRILITTGSKELAKYTALADYEERCFARVLSTAQVVEDCKCLGFQGKNLIAMQGPFSEELNYAMLKQIDAAYLVTKQSGHQGGYPEKCEAALRAGVHIVAVGRPAQKLSDDVKTMKLEEAIAFFGKSEKSEEAYSQSQGRRKVYLIGMGPGSSTGFTLEAERCLLDSQVVIGAGRILDICTKLGDKPRFSCYRGEEIAAFLRENPQYERAAVVFSGDVGFYSGARGVREYLQEYDVQTVPGIASPVCFLDKLGIAWEEVHFASRHGQECRLVPLLRQYKRVCLLLGREQDIPEICEELLQYHMEGVRITVGERLSYPEEQIFTGSPEKLRKKRFDALSIALFENDEAQAGQLSYGMEDSGFVRGRVPMTKEEIRVLSLSKLKLRQDSVLYDVGAGTGSVSVEAARICSFGRVYAIERNQEALALIEQNKERFDAEALWIVAGKAPEALNALEKPTHVFIGGSGGRLKEIVAAIRNKNPHTRFVVNAVTLETLWAVRQLAEEYPAYADMEILQVNVARSRILGDYHMMSAENPVFIISFGG